MDKKLGHLELGPSSTGDTCRRIPP